MAASDVAEDVFDVFDFTLGLVISLVLLVCAAAVWQIVG